MHKGFSLIELLISLIIISVITASLAPVLTGKTKHGAIALSQKSKIKKVTNQCSHTGSDDCKLCYEGEMDCLLCFVSCAGGQYADNSSCSCKSCGEFGSACVACDKNGCTRCQPGYGLQGGSCTQCSAGYASDGLHACSYCSGEKEYSSSGAGSCSTCASGKKANSGHTGCEGITCPSGQYLSGDNCSLCPIGNYCINSTKTPCANGFWQDLTGQSVCKECVGSADSNKTLCCKYGTVVRYGECYNPCENYGNSFFIPTISSTSGICMAKYNAGDDLNTISIPSGVTIKKVSAAQSGASSKTCWGKGNTSDANDIVTSNSDAVLSTINTYNNYSAFSYPTNKRVVCNWVAANAICTGNNRNSKTWRLPTQSELKYIVDNIQKVSRGLGSDGLQLCDSTAGLGCSNSSNPSCRSSDFQHQCYPSYVHGATVDSKNSYYLYDSKEVSTYLVRYQPRSVRCVVDVSF